MRFRREVGQKGNENMVKNKQKIQKENQGENGGKVEKKMREKNV